MKSLRTGGDSNRREPRTAIQDIYGQESLPEPRDPPKNSKRSLPCDWPGNLPRKYEWKNPSFRTLVAKCSATTARIAATPLECGRASEVQTTCDTLHAGPGWGATGLFGGGGGGSCDTPATPSKLQKEPRRVCSYTLERGRGGRSVCAT